MSTNNNQKIVQFSEEEFLNISRVVKSFVDTGVSQETPQFIIVAGGVAAGKTTIRRQKYAQGFINFEFREVILALGIGDDIDNLKMEKQKAADMAAFASSQILQEAFHTKKNIVIEVIGDLELYMMLVVDGMKKLGYDVQIEYVYADPVEAYKRHLTAVEDDPSYCSAYFTQQGDFECVLKALEMAGIRPQLGADSKEK